MDWTVGYRFAVVIPKETPSELVLEARRFVTDNQRAVSPGRQSLVAAEVEEEEAVDLDVAVQGLLKELVRQRYYSDVVLVVVHQK